MWFLMIVSWACLFSLGFAAGCLWAAMFLDKRVNRDVPRRSAPKLRLVERRQQS